MITLYLGDVDEYLSNLAYTQDVNAKLLTEKNFTNLPSGTYDTSLGDIGGVRNLGLLLQQCDRIIYAPPPNGKWSGGSKMQEWTEDYLKIFSFRTRIENYQRSDCLVQDMLDLADHRKTQDQQLWILGCSVSHGVGVANDQRYGQLLSDRLNLPASFLTRSGASIIWAADQIQRSDIRKHDIVVWGLTSDTRLPYHLENVLAHVTPTSILSYPDIAKVVSPDYLISKDLLYRNLISIYQVINLCNKVGAQLIMASILDSNIIYYLRDFPNFIMLSHLWGRDAKDLFADLGSDNGHPGPNSHQFYADQIYQRILQIQDKGRALT